MTIHRYKLGQVVSWRLAFPSRPAIGHAEIVRLMPPTADGEHHYRVRGADNVTRAVSESQIVLTAPSA